MTIWQKYPLPIWLGNWVIATPNSISSLIVADRPLNYIYRISQNSPLKFQCRDVCHSPPPKDGLTSILSAFMLSHKHESEANVFMSSCEYRQILMVVVPVSRPTGRFHQFIDTHAESEKSCSAVPRPTLDTSACIWDPDVHQILEICVIHWKTRFQ